MTLKRFLTLLENLFLDETEFNSVEVIGSTIVLETQDGSRFMISVEQE
jgi:hypothetical protein